MAENGRVGMLMSESNGRDYVISGSSRDCRDTAQPAALPDDFNLKLSQMARKIATNLEEFRATGKRMESATRQLSSGVQRLNDGGKIMKQAISSLKLKGEV